MLDRLCGENGVVLRMIVLLTVCAFLPGRMCAADVKTPKSQPVIDVKILAKELSAEDKDTRLKAAKAIRRLGKSAREAEIALVKALADKDVEVRLVAAHALVRAQLANKAIPVLFDIMLKGRSKANSWKARDVLDTIGRDNSEAVLPLISRMKTFALEMNKPGTQKVMYLGIQRVLANVGPASVMPLAKVVEDTTLKRDQRVAAMQALTMIGFLARGATDVLLGALGDRPGEAAAYEQAIEINPDFAEGHFFLAKSLLDSNQRLDRAIELAHRGLELGPESDLAPMGHFLLADIYSRLGRRQEAQTELAAARALQGRR